MSLSPQAPPPGAPAYGWRPAPPPLAPNGLPLADFGSRLGAFVIDRLILGGIQVILLIPLILWWFFTFFDLMSTQMTQLETNEGFVQFYLAMWVAMLVYVGVAVVLGLGLTYAYFVEYALRRDGQTIGKRLLGLKVAPVDPAAPLTRTDLLKRWAVESVAGAFVPFLIYVDGLWQLWDQPLRQCLHDKAAQTVVVKLG